MPPTESLPCLAWMRLNSDATRPMASSHDTSRKCPSGPRRTGRRSRLLQLDGTPCPDPYATLRQQARVRRDALYAAISALKAQPGADHVGEVQAWNVDTGKRVWTHKYTNTPNWGPMLATAGDLVFTGNPEGEFFALDARNGNRLWSFQTGAGHRGASVTYAINGRQYIATTTGFQRSVVGSLAGSLFPDQDFRQGSTLVVFALPEGTR